MQFMHHTEQHPMDPATAKSRVYVSQFQSQFDACLGMLHIQMRGNVRDRFVVPVFLDQFSLV